MQEPIQLDSLKKEEPETVQTDKTIPTQKEIFGKYLLRDMPLFKYEIIGYVVVGFFVFFVSVLERVGAVENLLSKVMFAAILAPIIFWAFKYFRYMPSKYKVPSVRVYKSGVIELGIDDIRKGYITYGSGDNLQRKYITKLNKHYEASTGRPFLITSELHGENISLVDDPKPDMKSEEFNAILETNTAVTTKKVMNRMLQFSQPSVQNPLFLMLVANLALCGVIILKLFGVFEMIKGG